MDDEKFRHDEWKRIWIAGAAKPERGKSSKTREDSRQRRRTSGRIHSNQLRRLSVSKNVVETRNGVAEKRYFTSRPCVPRGRLGQGVFVAPENQITWRVQVFKQTFARPVATVWWSIVFWRTTGNRRKAGSLVSRTFHVRVSSRTSSHTVRGVRCTRVAAVVCRPSRPTRKNAIRRFGGRAFSRNLSRNFYNVTSDVIYHHSVSR